MEKIGQHIFMSLGVMKAVGCNILIYIPSLIAFSSAFHCFLFGDPVFDSWVSSALKVLTMMIGEYEFDSHFVYSEVQKNGGRNISIQVYYLSI